MSERGKRVFRFLLDPERDTDVIGRIEAQPSMTGYVRELVRRDIHEREMHDERLDFAALKASELQAENAKLRHDLEEANNQAEEVCIENAVLREVCIENAKLRELVRDLYEGLRCPTEPDDGCPSCPFNSDDGCTFELRMAELGIEVEQ